MDFDLAYLDQEPDLGEQVKVCKPANSISAESESSVQCLLIRPLKCHMMEI